MAAITTRHNIFVQLSDFDWYKQQQNTNKLKIDMKFIVEGNSVWKYVWMLVLCCNQSLYSNISCFTQRQ